MTTDPNMQTTNTINQSGTGTVGTSVADSQLPGGSDYVPGANSSGSAISLDQLAPAKPLNIPAAPPVDNSQADGMVASAGQTSKSVDAYIKDLTPTPTAADKQNQSILDSMASLIGQQGQQGQDQANAEASAGIPGMQTTIQGFQNELNTATAAYDKKYANAGVGIGQTSSDVLGQQGAIRNVEAADIAVIQAKISAAQGNLTLAQNQVNRAIDLKYSTIDAQIKTNQAQLNALLPTLNREDKITALAQQQKLTDQANTLADKKAQEATNINTAITAGVQTNFVNQNGKFFDARTGQVFANSTDFFKAAGVTSFADAYQRGLVTDVNGKTMADQNFAAQAQAKYPDAGIKSTDTQEQVAAKLKNSRLYQKDTYIAPPAGSGSGPASDIAKLLQLGMQGNVPAALAPYQKTSYGGTKFIDLSSLNSSDKTNYAYIATKLGLPVIYDAADSAKINAIADANVNIKNIQDSVNKIDLGKGVNAPLRGVSNSINKLLGNSDLKSYNAWRTAIINNVQALAGGAGSGLRINQAEIGAAMENDLPVVTGTHADTPASATAKLSKLQSQLDTWEKQLVGGGNQATDSQTIPKGTDGSAYGFPGYVSDGTQWIPSTK